MLTQIDKENILKEFPNVKLSYENITHKKVYKSDYIVAVPEGKKCFAWFTSVNDKAVCLIMELKSNNKIYDIKITNACFSNELSYGTILYGTLTYNINNRFFFIEDIFSYKGIILDRESWGSKLSKIHNILKNDLIQITYNNSFIVFGLPLLCKNNLELENKIPSLNYKIEKIQFFLFDKTNCSLFMQYKDYINKNTSYNSNQNNSNQNNNNQNNSNQNNNKNVNKDANNKNVRAHINSEFNPKQEIIFLIRPDIQDDIYYLHCLNNEENEEQHGILHIPNYTISVMMNKLFRVIKENDNLDALEESDDEEEFQNENVDKFVYLDKSYKMVCKYNHRFKRWTPIKLSNNDKIITNEQLKNIYRFYEQNRKRSN